MFIDDTFEHYPVQTQRVVFGMCDWGLMNRLNKQAYSKSVPQNKNTAVSHKVLEADLIKHDIKWIPNTVKGNLQV